MEARRDHFPTKGYRPPVPRRRQIIGDRKRDRMREEPVPFPCGEAELAYLKDVLGIQAQGLF